MKKLIRKICIDYSLHLTILFTALALWGMWASRGIELKLSMTDLLPQDHPNVQKFNKLVEVVGGVGYVEILLHAEDAKSHLEIAPSLVEKLKTSPLVRSAFYQREEHYFLTHALYYMKVPDLKKLKTDIDQGITKAKRKFFDIGLWDDEEKKDEATEKKFALDPELQKVADRFSKMSPYLLSADGKDLLVMIKPSFDSLDMGKNRQIVNHSLEVLKSLPATVSYKMSGRYYGKIRDGDMMEKDMAVLGVICNVVMALILLFYFRSFASVVSIFIPVVLGLGMTALAIRYGIGHINIITGFLVGIISGIGSDYGIHMLWRLRLELQNPSSDEPNVFWRCLQTAGWANVITIVSTGLCFFFMCFSQLKVFSEFGFVCGVGLFSIMAAKLGTFHWTSKVLGLEKAALKKFPFTDKTLFTLAKPIHFYLVLVSGIVLTVLAAKVDFEFDFEKMMEHTKEVRETGHLIDVIYDRSTVPSAFAAYKKEEAVELENYLKEKYYPKVIKSIVSGATIVPENQAEKFEILKTIEKSLRNIKDKQLAEFSGIPAKAIRTWVSALPFTYNDIPGYIREVLRGQKENSYMLYIYPEEHLNTGPAVERFAHMIQDVGEKFPTVLSGSDAGIFNDILDLIKRDGIIILSVIFIFVWLFIWGTLRNFKEGLLCYVPFMFSLPVFVGMMAISGVKFNIFNVALLPAFIAVGIEIPIQLMQRAKEIKSGFQAVRDIAVGLQLALLTTAIGFGALVFTRAGVLKSLGWISLMATFSIWVVGVFLQPAILERYFKAKK